MKMPLELPELPYAYDALVIRISKNAYGGITDFLRDSKNVLL